MVSSAETVAAVDAVAAGARPGTGAVLALKPLPAAKSRLAVAPALRERLALAMFVDTVRVVGAAVEQTVVISDEPGLQTTLARLGCDVEVRPERAPGLNPALRQGAGELVRHGCVQILACLGDLPALHPADLDLVLTAATPRPRAFLSDTSGSGTTMMISDADRFDPRFGPGSARAHRDAGAVDLTDDLLGAPAPRARRDVDTADDLREAVGLGVGSLTASLLDPADGRLGDVQWVTVADSDPASGDYRVITRTGHRLPMAVSALHDHDPAGGVPLRLRAGQRLHAVTFDDRVLSAWC